MKSRSRALTLIMAFAIISSAFAGCGKGAGSTSSSPAATADAKKETVNLTVCLPDQQWGSSRDADLQAEVIKTLEEKTNTKINAIIPPQGSYKEKVAILVSSGDIPDVFRVMQAMSLLPGFAVRGQILPLDEYIKKSPVLSKIDKATFDYINIDGKKYFLPKLLPLTKNLWLRKDVADKNGINLPENPTTDQFYTEMKKLVGKDVIPFSFPKFIDNFRFFYNAFGVYDGIYQKDGKFVDGYQVPETKDALEYIKKLYKDGIIDKEFITTENAVMREKLSNGKAALDIDYANRYIYYVGEANKFKVPTEFSPINTLVGPKGKSGNLNEAIQDGYVVGAKCKNPQRAVDYIEYIGYNQEGITLDTMGIEGKHFVVENGVGKASEKALNAGYIWNPGFVILEPIKMTMGFKWDEATEKGMPQQTKIYAAASKYNGPSYSTPAGISDTFDKVSPSIKSTREEIATKVVLGSLSVDEGIAEYAKFWKSIGGDDILKELNSKMGGK